MADPDETQRDDVSRSVEAAERAGSIFTDQVRSIIDAAQVRARETEREASEAAEKITRDARETTSRVLEHANRLGSGILSAERELTSQLGRISEQAEALRTRLHRVRSDSKPERPSGPGPPAGNGAPVAESKARPELSPTGSPEPAQQKGRKGPARTGVGEARGLVEVARAQVRGKPDVELAETYDLASALVGRVAEPAESVYWQAMLRSAVEEAAARPGFGAPAPGEDVGDRRAQRRRAKDLRPLLEALRQHAEGGGEAR